MLDNVELIMYMKFKKILIAGCRDIDQNHQKFQNKGGVSPLCDPKDFFLNQALSLLYPYGALASCKKLKKN